MQQTTTIIVLQRQHFKLSIDSYAISTSTVQIREKSQPRIETSLILDTGIAAFLLSAKRWCKSSLAGDSTISSDGSTQISDLQQSDIQRFSLSESSIVTNPWRAIVIVSLTVVSNSGCDGSRRAGQVERVRREDGEKQILRFGIKLDWDQIELDILLLVKLFLYFQMSIVKIYNTI